jgi:hypothetical protein
MANSNDDLSDIRPDSGINANVSPTQLPIRGEKRIIPAPVSPSDMNDEFEQAYFKSGQKPPNVKGYADSSARQQLVEASDFNVHTALSPYVDYVTIRLYNRGLGGNGTPDGNPAVYRFLINPSQVQINRTTLDGQAFARSGWQIGVWGEDSIQINLTGKTAGQYFAFGLTDKYQPYTESYRNLEQLQVVFENNGYWFEGEKAAEGPLAADFSRRIIKMHADVELNVGNFKWYGMFDSLTLSQSADEPFLMTFQISFIAWKERFRKESPYPDLIHNDTKRGADYGSWQQTALAAQKASQQIGINGVVVLPPEPSVSEIDALLPEPAISATPSAPAVTVAKQDQLLPQVDPTAVDSVPMADTLGINSSSRVVRNASRNNWNGVLA